MSWPKQFISVNGVRIATEDFVKDKEAILTRLNKEQPKKDAGQMMDLSQRKFEEVIKDTDKKEEETPVVIAPETIESDTESVEPIQVPVEKKKVTKKTKTKITKKSWWGK